MLTEAWVIWPYPKTASFNTKVSIWHKRRLHNFIICLQQYFIFILADHYCVSHYVQSKKKYDTKITSSINKLNEQKDNIWLFIAMSFYNSFQGRCNAILLYLSSSCFTTKIERPKYDIYGNRFFYNIALLYFCQSKINYRCKMFARFLLPV